MKKAIFIGLYMLICIISLGQPPDNLTGFKDGDSAFVNFIYKHVRYPVRAREWKKTGIFFIKISITGDGAIDTVKVLNTANQSYFNAEIFSTIYKTKGHWTKSKTDRIIILPLIFAFDDIQKNKEGNYVVPVSSDLQGLINTEIKDPTKCIFFEPLIIHALGTPRY